MDLGEALATAFGVAVPAAAVVGGLASGILSKIDLGLLNEFVTRDDEHADEALDDDLQLSGDHPDDERTDAQSETTPLISRAEFQHRFTHVRDKKTLALIAIGLVELVVRLSLAAFHLAAEQAEPSAAIIVGVFVWAYATLIPLLRPSVTPYYSLVVIYISNVLSAATNILITLLPADSTQTQSTWRVSSALAYGHVALCLIALGILFSMPLRASDTLPRKSTDGLNPAMDDWSTLGQCTTVSWLNSLIERGKRMPLEEHDVWQLARNLRSRLLIRKFESVQGRSLLHRLFKANARDLVLVAILTLCATALTLAQPVFLNRVLRALEARSSNIPSMRDVFLRPQTAFSIFAGEFSSDDSAGSGLGSAYLWAGIAFLTMLLKAEVELQQNFVGRRATLRAKGEATASLYLKATKRIDTSGTVGDASNANGKGGKETAGSADLGKSRVDQVSTDVNRIGVFMDYYTHIIATPLSIVFAAVFLYTLMGWSAFAGYVAVIIALPANHFLMKLQYRSVVNVMEMRDRRMRSMNEVIQMIKFIKFSAWETRWKARVLELRERELHQVLLMAIVMFFIMLLWDLLPVLVACISLTTFTYLAGHELSVSIAFPALATFGILTEQLTSLPIVFSFFQRMHASVTRIGDFLDEDEVPDWVTGNSQQSSAVAFEERFGCESATFVWNTTAVRKKLSVDDLRQKADDERRASRRSWTDILARRKTQRPSSDTPAPSASVAPATPDVFTLRNISVVFPRGKLSLIYGPTGSGKSSLLSALLGEMHCLEGRVFLPQFSTQLDHETGLRESISFCAQQPWLEHKSIKENILFGSPYNKTRYNAVLSACALIPDLKLLEDGDRTEIGENGIALSGGQKARVALARAVYAPTKTVVLDDVLSAVDTHTAALLIRRCFVGPLMQGRTLILVTHHVENILPHAAFVVRMANGVVDMQGSPTHFRAHGGLDFSAGTGSKSFGADPADKFEDEEDIEALGVQSGEAKSLVAQEAKAAGNVNANLYLTYLKAAGYWFIALLFLIVLLQRGIDLVQKIWIKTWSESYASDADSGKTPFGFPSATQSPLPYVAVYIGIQAFNVLCTVAAQLPNMYSSRRASRLLYSRMLDAVLRSPVRWFDKTPTGRILNRFAKDIDTVDSGLSFYVRRVSEYVISFFVAIATIAYGVPPFLIFAVILAYLHYYVANGYIKTSRDLNRLESTLRSPIISAFGELLMGISTVRAFGAEKRFMQALFNRLDRCQAASYYAWMTSYWLRLRFGVLGALTFFCSVILSLTVGIRAGLIAIIITQAQSIIDTFYHGMEAYVQAEQAFNGIERIAEYIDLPSEPPRFTDKRPPGHWPSEQGDIKFEDVVIKYDADLNPVLKNLSFTIKPGEKIGLVGRTGSGKTTLALSLFRFVEPAHGRIIIDGIDITSLGVEDLRSRLTLIPQDAVLFKGSIRENLDPFNEYNDAECLAFLRAVQLFSDEPDATTTLGSTTGASGTSTPGQKDGSHIPATLDSLVSEGGNNWSAGQRQLIAMARALLRKTRIIVLDESTASVDFETDKKIQRTIRGGFKDSIMLIIAHRLHTIIDCDRILVLDAGKLIEFDTPLNLISRRGGVFRGMCEKGEDFEALRAAAKEAAKTA